MKKQLKFSQQKKTGGFIKELIILENIFLRCFQKIEEDRTLPSLFYESSTTLISKPEKDTTRKENYRTDFGPDESIGRYTLPPCTTKRRITTNIKTKK